MYKYVLNILINLINKFNNTSHKINNIEFKYNLNITSYEKLLKFKALEEWCNNLKSKDGIITNGGIVGPVEIKNVTNFGNNIGFLLMNAKVKINNSIIPSVCFLRNKCVAVLPLFYDENNELYGAFVKQFRAPVGSFTIEVPAGVCDDNCFKGQAATELKEELGLEIKSENIKWLHNGVLTSPGGSNEEIVLGIVIVENFNEQLPKNILNKIKGVKEHGE